MLQHGSCSACTAAQLQQRSLRTAELHSGTGARYGTAAHVHTNTAVYLYIDLAASRLAVYVITHMQPQHMHGQYQQHIIDISQESAV